MQITRRQILTASLAFSPARSAFAQDWPARPIRVVVPWQAGGSSDIVARISSQALGDALKQPVVIDNKPGANGNLGADIVAKAAPDGHTILIGDIGSLAISPALYKMSFDPSRDLRGVTMLTYSPHLLLVNPSVPVRNIEELVALSKKVDLNFAVSAMGSAPHVAGVAIERASGARWSYVPYKGGTQALTDTAGGQTQILVLGMLAALPFVQSGRLKVLGVSKGTRMAAIPDVPTIAEQGFPGFESGSWQGAVVPRATPDAVVARLNAELTRIIRRPENQARLAAQGTEAVTMSPSEQDAFFEKERARWGQVIAQAKIKAD